MAAGNAALYAFNRGLVSPLALARADVKRLALSAEIQTNWMPRVLGSMMLRAGWQFILSTYNNLKPKYLPFVFSTTDVALIECTDGTARIINPGADGTPTAVLRRPAVGSAVTNGGFVGNILGWTGADQAGALSQWSAPNLMQLTGTGFNAAIRYQLIGVGGPDIGTEHALRIIVGFGEIVLNVGTAAGDGTYAMNVTLPRGTHSIAFTPAGNFYIHVSNVVNILTSIISIQIETAGDVLLPTPWAAADLGNLRVEQSGEIVYVACDGHQQQKIARHGSAGNAGARSWSVMSYEPNDGPFLPVNVGGTTLAASATSGQITLVASHPLFRSGHVGALFRLSPTGQIATVAAGGAMQFTAAIKASGLSSEPGRNIGIEITGTFVATVVLQRSVGAIGAWEDVPGQTWTAPTAPSTGYNDGLDNQVIYYRLGIESAYTSGTANCLIALSLSGSITGICRITLVTDSQHAFAQVLIRPGDTGVLSGLGSVNATNIWNEGMWSNAKGFPTAVGLYEGRMAFAGRGGLAASVSDAYESFDDTKVGDSGPVIETVGSGPVDVIPWLLPLAELIAGGQGAEMDIRSSVFGGVLTPTTFALKFCSTLGSASTPAARVDFDGFFVQRSRRRIYKLTYTPSFLQVSYKSTDVTNFVPDIAVSERGVKLAIPGIAMITVQRQPDTRIHALLNDGTVRALVFDPNEDMQCWVKVETSGLVEDIIVLPGQGDLISEDLVYYVVNRTINGLTVRYLERWAFEEDCWGATITKCVDSHVTGTQAPSMTIGGMSHLIGQSVVCWADGKDQGGPFVVDGSGSITLPVAVSAYCAGLPYTASFMSSKLAYAAEAGTPLTQKKRVTDLGLVMQNVHYQGLRYGKDFDNLQDLPTVYKGEVQPADTVYIAYDDAEFPFGGAWDTDSRLCLQAASPRPCTVLAAVIDMETREST